ncbi:MAG: hypothetical protein HOV83_27265, partial [Catenulispora sp.]|nr:hypothetical protein [Catenulispora sp.]
MVRAILNHRRAAGSAATVLALAAGSVAGTAPRSTAATPTVASDGTGLY